MHPRDRCALCVVCVRHTGKDDATVLSPPKLMTLEDAVEYVVDGEFVEVTPDAIRMGKAKPPPKTKAR